MSGIAAAAGQSAKTTWQGGAAPALLNLFGPIYAATRLLSSQGIEPPLQVLWSADAVHRANNLSQIISSLGRVATRHSASYPADIEQRAAALALCYAKLGEDGEETTLLPCTDLLRDVASGLNSLFAAKAQSITLRFVTDQLSLPRAKRRALILIASELIVNALKYAFPSGVAGEISVSLHINGGWAELIIHDDGIGLAGVELPGEGSRILDALSGVLGGRIARTSPATGLRVCLSFKR